MDRAIEKDLPLNIQLTALNSSSLPKLVLTVFVLFFNATNALSSEDPKDPPHKSALGFVQYQEMSEIGITLNRAYYVSRHPEDEHISRDVLTSMPIWTKYHINKNWSIRAKLPYAYYLEDEKIQKGIGDLDLELERDLIYKGNADDSEEFLWFAAMGVKFPTGTYNQELHEISIPNHSPGSGSYDVLMSTNITYRHNNLGVNGDISYSLNTANPDDNKEGNHLMSNLKAFYQKKYHNSILVPLFGAEFAQSQHDFHPYSERTENPYSGRKQVSALVGLDWYFRYYAIRTAVFQPVYSYIATGYVEAKPYCNISLIFLLKSKSELLAHI